MKELLSKGSDNTVVPLRRLVHTCAKPDALYTLPDRLYSTKVGKQLPCVSSGFDVIAAMVPGRGLLAYDMFFRRRNDRNI